MEIETKNNKVTDELETMLIMAMNANHIQSNGIKTQIRDRVDGSRMVIEDQGNYIGIDSMFPKSSFTLDISDEDRLYSSSHEGLINHPSDILGDEAEVIMLLNDRIKWFGFRKLKKSPKNVTYLGKPSHWYEAHLRIVSSGLDGSYIKRAVPIDSNGNVLPALYQKATICGARERDSIILSCSIIEDSMRSNAMLASVKEQTEIKFPVPLDDYQEIFLSRDGPKIGNKKRPIIHWVARHLRNTSRGNEHKVKKHTRGLQEFLIDGLSIKITPNRVI